MTCIVGLIENGQVYIGSDSCGMTVATLDTQIRYDPKLIYFQKEELIIGGSGSFRCIQVIRDYLDVINIDDCIRGLSESEYVSKFLIPEIIKIFDINGCLSIENATKTSYCELLVGVKDKLFYIGSDFQVGQVYENWLSIGCGSVYANGSLYALSKYSMKPENRILRALEAAEYYNGGVRSPFYVIANKQGVVL